MVVVGVASCLPGRLPSFRTNLPKVAASNKGLDLILRAKQFLVSCRDLDESNNIYFLSWEADGALIGGGCRRYFSSSIFIRIFVRARSECSQCICWLAFLVLDFVDGRGQASQSGHCLTLLGSFSSVAFHQFLVKSQSLKWRGRVAVKMGMRSSGFAAICCCCCSHCITTVRAWTHCARMVRTSC